MKAFDTIIAKQGIELKINGISWIGITQHTSCIRGKNKLHYTEVRRHLLQPEGEYHDVVDPDEFPSIHFDMTDSESEFENSHQFQTDFVNNKMIQAVDLYSDEQGFSLRDQVSDNPEGRDQT